jgi:accessory gene regulator protein AgrB
MSFLRCKSVSLPSFIFVFCLDDITKVCRWEICPNHEDANPITHTRKKKKKKKNSNYAALYTVGPTFHILILQDLFLFLLRISFYPTWKKELNRRA